MTEPSNDLGLLAPIWADTLVAEQTGDAAYLQAMLDAEFALSRALAAAGLAPDWVTAAVDDLAERARPDLPAIVAEARGGGNPVIPLTRYLYAAAEDVRPGLADHIHRGATSQDIMDTATMLVARRAGGAIMAAAHTLATRLAELADRHRATVLAGRTLGQQAAPTSFGFKAAGWLDGVLVAARALDDVLRDLPVQLGGAVGTGAALYDAAERSASAGPDAGAERERPADVVNRVLDAYAAELGLRRPMISWHTQRGVIADLGHALAGLTGSIGKIAADVSVLSRTEIAEVHLELPAGSGGSSAMPHKRNPVPAVLLLAAARQAAAPVATLHASLVAEEERPSGAWHAEWSPLRELLRLAGAATETGADLAGRLRVDADQMRRNLEATGGAIMSERLVGALTAQAGRKRAQQITADVLGADRAPGLRVKLLDHPDVALTDGQIDDLLDPARYLGMADEFIDAVLRDHASRTTSDEDGSS
ncbi:lyase family protein [Saxibacter everestensis]|uniref:Lyase family protein n=1 Tax=Saxibacter everestensis TaxID=2909229 RepID=A0ABY8QSI3_9MICO|nr:lyase family protein [Brevibacteriaceae bacterium ZFBP1038]